MQKMASKGEGLGNITPRGSSTLHPIKINGSEGN